MVKIPDKLYKYMPWRWVDDETTGEKRNYTKELIENNQFYLTLSNQLNDPFDCSMVVKMDIDKEEYIEKYLPRIRGVSDDKKHIIKALSAEEFQEKVKNARFEGQKEKIGITCFSANHCISEKAILMWSHYADDHKGICLVFNTNIDNGFWKEYVNNISYQKKIPIIKFSQRSHNIDWAVEVLTKKSPIWKNEKEYRIIGPVGEMCGFNSGPLLAFNSESLVEVICGCNMNNDKINQVSATLKRRKSEVKLSKAIKKTSEFGLYTEHIGNYGG